MLLHATLAAAEPLGLRVLALHVHHGLSAHADDWLAHCRERCRRQAARGRPLAFAATRLATRPAPGESVEAWARRERYRALAEMARDGGADLVLLAHHRRDQAETFLLQALRGGGVAALAAMPAAARRQDVLWARPLLDVPAAALDAYARRHRLRGVEDDSNADARFARNRLRVQVWPALTAAFPDAEATLAMAAAWAQEAARIVAEVAARDLSHAGDGDGLHIGRWRELSAARGRQAVRAWLQQRCGRPAPPSLVDRLMVELEAAETRRWPAPGGTLHSYRGRLAFEPALPQPEDGASIQVDLSRRGRHQVPGWGGSFRVTEVDAGGVAVEPAARLELRARRPGDRFQAAPGRPPRSLKLQFQSAGVPARQRTGPVACADGRIVYVPGLGIDARAIAGPGEAQVMLSWLPERDRGQGRPRRPG